MKILENGFFPVIVVIALAATYILADNIFVQCNWLNLCTGIDSENISQVLETTEKDLKKIPEDLKNKIQKIKVITEQVKTKEDEIKKKQEAIDTKNREISGLSKANANSNGNSSNSASNSSNSAADTTENSTNTDEASQAKNLKEKRAELTKLKEEKEKLEAELTGQNKEKTELENQILGTRSLVASRYSSRMTWTFLTPAFFLLCIAAIWVSCSAIKKSVDDKKLTVWIVVTAVVGFGFAALAFFYKENYMSIVIPMYEKSIAKYGDVTIQTINFFNALGFAAIIFLVAASSAILSSILRKNKLNDTTPQSYDEEKNAIRNVLYVGALMLFVAMLRIKLLSDWHLAFVSANETDSFYKLLSGFFKSSISVQAAFYTILLAIIYVPVIYAIPSKTADENEQGWFEKLGLPFGGDSLPRFISIISPFLAGPIAEIFKSFGSK